MKHCITNIITLSRVSPSVWSEYTAGPCSASCGPGEIVKTRECVDSTDADKVLDSSFCEGGAETVEECNLMACTCKVINAKNINGQSHLEFSLGPAPTIHSSDSPFSDRWDATGILTNECDNHAVGNYFLLPDYVKNQGLVLDRGCSLPFDTVQLKNTHNQDHNDRFTNHSQVVTVLYIESFIGKKLSLYLNQ